MTLAEFLDVTMHAATFKVEKGIIKVLFKCGVKQGHGTHIRSSVTCKRCKPKKRARK